MAGLRCIITPAAAISFSAGVAKTGLILIAPSNHRLQITQIGGFTTLASPTAAPGTLTIYTASTAGTTTSLTPKLLCAGSETPQATGGCDATVEPSVSEIKKIILLDRGYMEARAINQQIEVPGGTRIALKFSFAAAVDILPYIEYEE